MTRVPIVDEAPQIRRLLQAGLQEYDHDTITAATGESELARAAQSGQLNTAVFSAKITAWKR